MLMPKVSWSKAAKALAVSCERAASNVVWTTRSTPVSRSSRTRSSGTVRYRGSKPALSTDAGWLLKVRTTEESPLRAATSFSRATRLL